MSTRCTGSPDMQATHVDDLRSAVVPSVRRNPA
jgi:hypothetical protein